MSTEEFELLSNEDYDEISLDINIVKNNIPNYTSIKLCEMIVCDRYLGFNQGIAIFCMEELAKRRLAGDEFKFEDYIEESMKGLPDLTVGAFDIRGVLNKAINFK